MENLRLCSCRGEFATHCDARAAVNLPEDPSGGELAHKSLKISSRLTKSGNSPRCEASKFSSDRVLRSRIHHERIPRKFPGVCSLRPYYDRSSFLSCIFYTYSLFMFDMSLEGV
jgi:hypothetical protein